ncbi:MAG: hypothetical protein Q8Q32_00070 [bacterium]|nr:hypothetical protein [bacterium]
MKAENKQNHRKVAAIISILILTSLFVIPNSAFAFTNQQITKNNPAVLPENPFYVFKSWTRDIQNFFISNPIKKLMFNAHVLDQKGAEIAIALDLSSKISDTTLQNYSATSLALADKISKLSPEILQANISLVFDTSDQLIDYLLGRLIIHIQLQDKILESVDSDKIRQARTALVGAISDLAELDLDPSLSERIQMIARSQGNDFALQFIETEKAPFIE